MIAIGTAALVFVTAESSPARRRELADCFQLCRQDAVECRRDCPGCSDAYDEAIADGCGPCGSDAVSARHDCVESVRTVGFQTCLDKTCHPIAGKCTVTLECVHDCLSHEPAQIAGCRARFHAQVKGCERTEKVNCLQDARIARRACKVVDRPDCRQMCATDLRACRSSCRAAAGATTTTTTTALTSGSGIAVVPHAGGCDCQRACVEGIVSDCYAECDDRCEGNGDALAICRRGCRNDKCNAITRACTADVGGSGTTPYELCCTQCGDTCESDLADQFACEQVTTTTRTTTTVTTTTAAGVTTTTIR